MDNKDKKEDVKRPLIDNEDNDSFKSDSTMGNYDYGENQARA